MAFGFGFALTAIAKAVGFTPRSLFTSGAQGAWYDPSDYSTMFEDAAGTIPITSPLEKPVGLMLDKSKGLVLGSELVTNGDFSGGSTGWTISGGYWSISSGTATLNTTLTDRTLYQTIPGLAANKVYQVSITIVSVSAGAIDIGIGTITLAELKTLSAPGTYTFLLKAGSLDSYLRLFNRNNATTNVTVDNVSVKEVPGNHATQSTTTSRPTLSARYNLLTKTEQFDDAAWSKYQATVTANQEVAPNGTNTADLYTSAGTASGTWNRSSTWASAGAYKLSIGAKRSNHDWVVVYASDTASSMAYAFFNLATGAVGEVTTSGSVFSGVSAAIEALPGGFYRLSITYTKTATASSDVGFCTATNNGSLTRAAGQTAYIWGADLRVANDGVGLPAYQRVNTATDYDYAGFPPYLKFDGTDDSLVTNSIDFSATDKMTVWAGVRKLSDAAAALVLELGSNAYTSNGAFYIAAPEDTGAAGNFTVFCKGSASGSPSQLAKSTVLLAPKSVVLTSNLSISDDLNTLRINGSANGKSATGDQGSGNFGAYPLFIGRRNNASNPFNGRIYSLIVCGKLASASEITSTESYINNKTKAY